MEFVVNTAKVTKLDMNYSDWSPDMKELFGQKVYVMRGFFDEPDHSVYRVKLENGNCYSIPEDWLTFEKEKRKPTSYKHKLVCVSTSKNYFTAGKVYLFDKGVLF